MAEDNNGENGSNKKLVAAVVAAAVAAVGSGGIAIKGRSESVDLARDLREVRDEQHRRAMYVDTLDKLRERFEDHLTEAAKIDAKQEAEINRLSSEVERLRFRIEQLRQGG